MRERADDTPVTEAEAAALFGDLAGLPSLVVAVSGGPDSIALLWLMARWRSSMTRGPKLIAVTVDHGLRPQSAHEALAVKRLCKRLGVEHRTLRWIGRKPKTGIQVAAREARYRLLSGAARKAGARHILTAHTLDDQAETVLFRMARGSGVSGLAGMGRSAGVPVDEGRGLLLVRPLLTTSKARLVATLGAAKIAYATDPSNADPRFARSRLRALLPVLAREGLTAERLGRLARRMERADDVLWRAFNAALAALWPEPWPSGGPVSVDRPAFVELPAEIAVRILARMIAHVGREGAPELGQLEALHIDLVCPGKPSPQSATPGRVRRTLAGALITLSGAKLTVERAPPRRSLTKTGTSSRKGAFTKGRSR